MFYCREISQYQRALMAVNGRECVYRHDPVVIMYQGFMRFSSMVFSEEILIADMRKNCGR